MSSILLEVAFAFSKNLIFVMDEDMSPKCILAIIAVQYLQRRMEHWNNLKLEHMETTTWSCWGRKDRNIDTCSIDKSNFHLHRLACSIYTFSEGGTN